MNRSAMVLSALAGGVLLYKGGERFMLMKRASHVIATEDGDGYFRVVNTKTLDETLKAIDAHQKLHPITSQQFKYS